MLVQYVTDDIDRLVDTNDVSAGPAVGADFTLLVAGSVGGAVARCLTVTMALQAGTARGFIIDIYGADQWGQPIRERVNFGTQDVSTTYYMHTRKAFLYVNRVNFVGWNGAAPVASDRLDVGIVHVAGTLSGTLITTNGAAAGRYKGVGLPIPVATSGTNTLGAASAGYESEIIGCYVAEDGTSGVSTNTILVRTGEFTVDGENSVFVPAEIFVATAGNISLSLWIASKRGA